jgi:hypothetical protein
MMSDIAKLINLAGLACDAVGATLMFLNTPYSSKEPSGRSGMDIVRQGAEWLFTIRFRERKQLKLIKVGFVLLIVGFLLQFLGAAVE